jgi:hypothetical protein
MTSVRVRKGSAERAVAGTEFRASTGRRHRETQVAWAKKAPRNFGGDFLISSKRESRPSSAVMREKRKVPTVCFVSG